MTTNLPTTSPLVWEDLGAPERDELAAAYLDLLSSLNEAINDSPHSCAFVTWSGRGYYVADHLTVVDDDQ